MAWYATYFTADNRLYSVSSHAPVSTKPGRAVKEFDVVEQPNNAKWNVANLEFDLTLPTPGRETDKRNILAEIPYQKWVDVVTDALTDGETAAGLWLIAIQDPVKVDGPKFLNWVTHIHGKGLIPTPVKNALEAL